MTNNEPIAKYQIGTVARATGVSAHTIRVWERRYSALKPARTAGGSRVYTDCDVQKLRLLKKLTGDGHAIGRIAHLELVELKTIAGEFERTEAPSRLTDEVVKNTVNKFMTALQSMDITGAERVLLYSAGFLDPQTLIIKIIAPIITEIGQRWEAGTLRISHEHAASALLRNLMGSLMRSSPPRPGASTVVATTLSGERHEFGALMAALMATVQGWNVVFLGPNLPTQEILHVVDHSDAAAILLSMVDDRSEDSATELQGLLGNLPEGVRLIVGGRGAHSYLDMLPENSIAASLPALIPMLEGARPQ